jgi:hypothetical protein
MQKTLGGFFTEVGGHLYTTNFLFVKGGHFEKHNAHYCKLFILKNACYFLMFFSHSTHLVYEGKKI